jgi:uncharacterized phage protein (TIGR01671 family)
MREIKFRVWNKDNKKMFYPEVFILNQTWKKEMTNWSAWNRFTQKGTEDLICNGKNGIIMQFTGLKDKNGKDVYEGDILQRGEGEHITQIKIRFGNGTFDSGCYNFTGFFGVWIKVGFGGGFKKGRLCEDLDEITQDNISRFEVIGNIYENGELK